MHPADMDSFRFGHLRSEWVADIRPASPADFMEMPHLARHQLQPHRVRTSTFKRSRDPAVRRQTHRHLRPLRPPVAGGRAVNSTRRAGSRALDRVFRCFTQSAALPRSIETLHVEFDHPATHPLDQWVCWRNRIVMRLRLLLATPRRSLELTLCLPPLKRQLGSSGCDVQWLTDVNGGRVSAPLTFY